MKGGVVRVLIVGLSKLVGEMLEASFAKRPGTKLVGAAERLDDLSDRIRDTNADVVIVRLEHSRLPPACREFMWDRARVKLLGVEETDGSARLYRLLPDITELGDVPPEELADLVETLAVSAEGAA